MEAHYVDRDVTEPDDQFPALEALIAAYEEAEAQLDRAYMGEFHDRRTRRSLIAAARAEADHQMRE